MKTIGVGTCAEILKLEAENRVIQILIYIYIYIVMKLGYVTELRIESCFTLLGTGKDFQGLKPT